MAVYTKVSESEAAAFLDAYDIGTFKELAGVKQGIQNTTYILYTTQDQYILTLYEERNVQEKDLPFFLGLMEHLAKKDVPCPAPVRTRKGELFGHLAGRAAAITGFLTGRVIARIAPDDCGGLGRALANMHIASAGFPLHRANNLSLDGWEKLLASCKGRADEVQPGLADFLQEELDYLRLRWPAHLPEGIIHADLFPDNVFFNGGTDCDMFDFYFACDDFLAYDLAICLNAWCFENTAAFNITKARALINGYSSVRPLAADEIKALPILARGAALRFLLTRLYDWLDQVPDALVKPKNPLEYLTRLQFHQMVNSVTAYGLAA